MIKSQWIIIFILPTTTTIINRIEQEQVIIIWQEANWVLLQQLVHEHNVLSGHLIVIIQIAVVLL